MDGRLQGKVALITGGGTGLGKAFAKRFVAEGAKVVIASPFKNELDAVAADLPMGSTFVYVGDITKEEDTIGMVDATVRFGGKIDVLVNNAGIDPPGTVCMVPVEQWRKVIDTNLTGTFLMMRAAIPHMIKQGGGSVINISSLAALRCIPAMPAYSASKAGIIGLTQAAAYDYGPNGVRCNVVCPGAVSTEMLHRAMAPLAETLNTDINGAFKAMSKFAPLRRVSDPAEIAGTVVFLASDDSSYMTGAVLSVDGGACVVDPTGAAVSSSGQTWGGGE